MHSASSLGPLVNLGAFIRKDGPWKGVDDVECATLDWASCAVLPQSSVGGYRVTRSRARV